MSVPRERSVSHSISGTALEWEQLRHLAEREGKTISRFIRDSMAERRRSLTQEAAEGDAQVLTLDEMRAMRDAAVRAEALISRLVERSGAASPDLSEAVRFLFEARLDDMARTGRHDSMRELLTSIVGPERAARIVRRVLNRRSPRS